MDQEDRQNLDSLEAAIREAAHMSDYWISRDFIPREIASDVRLAHHHLRQAWQSIERAQRQAAASPAGEER